MTTSKKLQLKQQLQHWQMKFNIALLLSQKSGVENLVKNKPDLFPWQEPLPFRNVTG